MQTAAGGAIVERMIGAARLNPRTYEEVEHDTAATPQAAIVVVLAAIAGGIGSIREDGIGGLIGGIFSNLIGWAIFAGLVYFIGTRLFATMGTSASWSEVARTLGFAYTPLLLSVFGFIPGIGPALATVGFVWSIVASVIAIRQALDFDTGRAVGTAVVAALVPVLLVVILILVFGLALYGFSN